MILEYELQDILKCNTKDLTFNCKCLLSENMNQNQGRFACYIYVSTIEVMSDG